jgi:hypothetical protein
MNTIDFIREGREYVQTPPLRAALKLLDEEDIESHIVVAFKNGAEYALENQWISVKERLPEITELECSDDIFIHGSGGYVGSAYFEDNKFYSLIGDDNILGVDYWMPIPKLNVNDNSDL